MSNLVEVVTVRATHLHGQHVEAGTRLSLVPVDAHALVANHKAQLCNPADAQALHLAVQRDDLAVVQSSPGYIPPVQRPY